MRKSKILSSVLVIVFFISFISINLGSGHFIQLGSQAFAAPITSAIVNLACDTSGNGGRKLVRLSNGNIYAGMLYNNSILIYKSLDNGATWSLFCSMLSAASIQGFALASDGTHIHCLATCNNSMIYHRSRNEDGTIYKEGGQFDDIQTAVGQCSLICDSSGKLTAAWSSKNSTYPDSFNIRFAKSTNGGTTWTKAEGTEGVDQATVYNTSGQDAKNPCVVYRANGYPMVIYEMSGSGLYGIRNTSWNTGTNTWSPKGADVYDGLGYVQSNPCAVVSPNGRIWVVWQGKDSTDTTTFNILCKYSDDNATTWTNGNGTTDKITSGNSYNHQQYPSVTVDKNNKVYIEWSGILASYAGVYNVRKIVNENGAWGSITDLTSTPYSQWYVTTCSNYTDFTDPLAIYQDTGVAAVKFRGEFGNLPILNVQTPTQNAALFPNLHSAERSA